MNEVTALFGARAQDYASFRPHYPDSLFAWLAAQCRQRQRALDIACGNGQASQPLRQHFAQVLACDASVEQLRACPDPQGLALFAADAQAQPLASHSLDLIQVAQALHWFATPAFFHEVRRLLKPGGLFCAWCYSLMSIDPRLDELIEDLYWNTLQGYWPQGRASVDAGYRDIHHPFSPLSPPPAAIEAHWRLEQLLGYLRTWSATQRYEQHNGFDPLQRLEPALRQAWGDANQPRFVRWPLHFLAGIAN
ncbi:class I SAM-dependent methyltransferase [Pseudomonas sp. XK-1]|uniref:class I SAM-dependent methyltransferase n=1 Tax=Pseudomonas sp. XK-1 TaxID=3136019 RepID=UPI00311A5377